MLASRNEFHNSFVLWKNLFADSPAATLNYKN